MSDAIAAVHAKDVEEARRLLQNAITKAGEAWIPSDAVIDALAQELIEMAGCYGCSPKAARHLAHVAELLRHTPARSH